VTPYLFSLAAKWFWIVLILSTVFNVRAFWLRAQPHIARNPALEAGYRALVSGALIFGILPWLIVGAGCLSGSVRSVFEFFRPRDGNPFVTAFYVLLFLEWTLGSYWILFRGGAKTLIDHPGLFNFNAKDKRTVILIWGLGITGSIVGVIFLFTFDIPRFPS